MRQTDVAAKVRLIINAANVWNLECMAAATVFRERSSNFPHNSRNRSGEFMVEMITSINSPLRVGRGLAQ